MSSPCLSHRARMAGVIWVDAAGGRGWVTILLRLWPCKQTRVSALCNKCLTMEPVSLNPNQREHKGFLQFIIKKHTRWTELSARPSPLWCISRRTTQCRQCLGQTHLSSWRSEGCCPPCHRVSWAPPQGPGGCEVTHTYCSPGCSARVSPLLIEPALGAVLPAEQLVGAEPERDLSAGTLHGVAAVNHILANLEAEISADGAGRSIRWVCGPD